MGMSSFHISVLARDWTQLALLPPTSHIPYSKVVSITVGDASVKVTNLMVAQDLEWLIIYSLHKIKLTSWAVMDS